MNNRQPQGIPPEVMGQITMGMLQVLSEPACLVELALNIWFPEIKQDYGRWLGLQISPSPGDVYDWVQKKFPEAPVRSDDVHPKEAFRELSKYIIAKAFGMEYKGPGHVIVVP